MTRRWCNLQQPRLSPWQPWQQRHGACHCRHRRHPHQQQPHTWVPGTHRRCIHLAAAQRSGHPPRSRWHPEVTRCCLPHTAGRRLRTRGRRLPMLLCRLVAPAATGTRQSGASARRTFPSRCGCQRCSPPRSRPQRPRRACGSADWALSCIGRQRVRRLQAAPPRLRSHPRCRCRVAPLPRHGWRCLRCRPWRPARPAAPPARTTMLTHGPRLRPSR